MIKTLMVFLLVFSVIVIIHEFGHFYFAKKAGIRVREFALGMGPKLFSKQDKSGTTFTVRMLPLGGYVRLAGLHEEEDIQAGMPVALTLNDRNTVEVINLSEKVGPDELPVTIDSFDLIDEMMVRVVQHGADDLKTYYVDKDAFLVEPDGTRILLAPRHTRYESATPWNKIKTNMAGPVNNFILAFVAFSIVAWFLPGIPSDLPQIGRVSEESPALFAGLKDGDYVRAIDGNAINSWSELVTFINDNPGKTVSFHIEREHSRQDITVSIGQELDPQTNQPVGRIGISRFLKTSIQARLKYGLSQTWTVMTLVITTILSMFKNGFDLQQFGGPVAMVQMTNEVVQYGPISVLSLLGMLSANLGVMNLLPIPALDGGKIILNIYEGIKGRPLSQEKEGIITLVGVGFLVILMVLVTWNDIIRAFF